MENASTLGILKQLERGEINASEADARLSAPPPVEREYSPRPEPFEIPGWARQLWYYALVGGVLLVLVGAWMIAATAHANILWLIFGVPIVLFGTLILAIAASAATGHWLYIQIEPAHRRRAFRLAIPFSMGWLRLALWLAQQATPHVRTRVGAHSRHAQFELSWEEPAEFLQDLERELTRGRCITIDVADQDERVQVYIV